MRVERFILLFVIWVEVRIRGVTGVEFLPALLGSVGRASGSLVATRAGDINARERRGHCAEKKRIRY